VSNNDPKPLTSQIAELNPRTADRAIALQMARELAAVRRDLSIVGHEQQRQGLLVAEIHGHLMRVDSTTRQVSSHDMEQDARLAELETGWRKLLHTVGHALASDRARAIADWAFRAVVAYLAAKGFKVLP
jgi:hypothetical protein